MKVEEPTMFRMQAELRQSNVDSLNHKEKNEFFYDIFVNLDLKYI